MGRKGRKRLLNALLIANVGKNLAENGNAATITRDLAAGESFMLSFKAYDMVNSIKVNGAEVNLKGYYNGLTDDSAKAMVIAIYNYVKAAAEYKAV